jgi:hypothetical protein
MNRFRVLSGIASCFLTAVVNAQAPQGLQITVSPGGSRTIHTQTWTSAGWILDIEATGSPDVVVTIRGTTEAHPIASFTGRAYKPGAEATT